MQKIRFLQGNTSSKKESVQSALLSLVAAEQAHCSVRGFYILVPIYTSPLYRMIDIFYLISEKIPIDRGLVSFEENTDCEFIKLTRHPTPPVVSDSSNTRYYGGICHEYFAESADLGEAPLAEARFGDVIGSVRKKKPSRCRYSPY